MFELSASRYVAIDANTLSELHNIFFCKFFSRFNGIVTLQRFLVTPKNEYVSFFDDSFSAKYGPIPLNPYKTETGYFCKANLAKSRKHRRWKG